MTWILALFFSFGILIESRRASWTITVTAAQPTNVTTTTCCFCIDVRFSKVAFDTVALIFVVLVKANGTGWTICKLHYTCTTSEIALGHCIEQHWHCLYQWQRPPASHCDVSIIVNIISKPQFMIVHGGKRGEDENAVPNDTGPDRCLGREAPRNDPPIRHAVAQAIHGTQQSTRLHTLSSCVCWTPLSHQLGHHHQ